MEAVLRTTDSGSSGLEPRQQWAEQQQLPLSAAAPAMQGERRLRRSSSSRSSNSGSWAASAPPAGTAPPLRAPSPTDSGGGGGSTCGAAQRARLVFKSAARGTSSTGRGKQAASRPRSPSPAAASALARPRGQGQTCCQVDGCPVLMQAGRETYNGRYRVCQRHMMVRASLARLPARLAWVPVQQPRSGCAALAGARCGAACSPPARAASFLQPVLPL